MMEKKNEWINDLLKNTQAEPTADKISQIECCGMGCAEHSGHLDSAKALREAAKECKTRSDYVSFIQKALPLKVEEVTDGVIIHYGKEECTCPMSPGVSNPMLCNCTLGYEKAMWSIFLTSLWVLKLLKAFNVGVQIAL